MMQYEKEYELRGADFDGCNYLRPASVLELFEDVASIHAMELGVGYEELMERQSVWVLTKVRYRVVRQPQVRERVRVRTWPLPPGRVNFRREYVIESLQGEPLILGGSEWVVMHCEKRRVLPATDLYPGDDYRMDMHFPQRLAKVPSFEPEDEGTVVYPAFTDLDINGHVNNTKYANYVLNARPPRRGAAVTELAIDYHREVLPGNALRIFCREESGVLLARGVSDAGETMFSCCMELTEA